LAITGDSITHTFLYDDEGKTGKLVHRYQPL
jgi:hypothetical protein